MSRPLRFEWEVPDGLFDEQFRLAQRTPILLTSLDAHGSTPWLLLVLVPLSSLPRPPSD